MIKEIFSDVMYQEEVNSITYTKISFIYIITKKNNLMSKKYLIRSDSITF